MPHGSIYWTRSEFMEVRPERHVLLACPDFRIR